MYFLVWIDFLFVQCFMLKQSNSFIMFIIICNYQVTFIMKYNDSCERLVPSEDGHSPPPLQRNDGFVVSSFVVDWKVSLSLSTDHQLLPLSTRSAKHR